MTFFKAKTKAGETLEIEIEPETRTVIVLISTPDGIVRREFEPFEAEMLGFYLIDSSRRCTGHRLT